MVAAGPLCETRLRRSNGAGISGGASPNRGHDRQTPSEGAPHVPRRLAAPPSFQRDNGSRPTPNNSLATPCSSRPKLDLPFVQLSDGAARNQGHDFDWRRHTSDRSDLRTMGRRAAVRRVWRARGQKGAPPWRREAGICVRLGILSRNRNKKKSACGSINLIQMDCELVESFSQRVARRVARIGFLACAPPARYKLAAARPIRATLKRTAGRAPGKRKCQLARQLEVPV